MFNPYSVLQWFTSSISIISLLHLHEVQDSHITKPDFRQVSGQASGSSSGERKCHWLKHYSFSFPLSLPPLLLTHGAESVFIDARETENARVTPVWSLFYLPAHWFHVFLHFNDYTTTNHTIMPLWFTRLNRLLMKGFCADLLVTTFPPVGSVRHTSPKVYTLNILSTSCPRWLLGSLFLDLLYAAKLLQYNYQ